MGLFSFLKSDKSPYSDKVWKENDYAIKGMMTDALQAITKNEMPIVVTFFSDTSQRVKDFLSAKQVPYFEIDSANTHDADSQTKVVFTTEANVLNSSSQLLAFLATQSKKQKLDFLFYGHYPIPLRENKILEKLTNIGSDITFYSSLDDRAFKIFGANQIKSTLEKIGLADDEAIEHAMVSRAMKNAREKIELSVKQEIICATEVEWFQRNYKSKKD